MRLRPPSTCESGTCNGTQGYVLVATRLRFGCWPRASMAILVRCTLAESCTAAQYACRWAPLPCGGWGEGHPLHAASRHAPCTDEARSRASATHRLVLLGAPTTPTTGLCWWGPQPCRASGCLALYHAEGWCVHACRPSRTWGTRGGTRCTRGGTRCTHDVHEVAHDVHEVHAPGVHEVVADGVRKVVAGGCAGDGVGRAVQRACETVGHGLQAAAAAAARGRGGGTGQQRVK